MRVTSPDLLDKKSASAIGSICLLATAIMHTLGIPVLLATTLVGSAAVTGLGDGTQLVALVLGLTNWGFCVCATQRVGFSFKALALMS